MVDCLESAIGNSIPIESASIHPDLSTRTVARINTVVGAGVGVAVDQNPTVVLRFVFKTCVRGVGPKKQSIAGLGDDCDRILVAKLRRLPGSVVRIVVIMFAKIDAAPSTAARHYQ